MWRFGLSGDEKRKAGTGRPKKTQEKPEKKRPAHEKMTEKKKSLKMMAPSLDARDRRGSIMAAEHLLMRRGSRGSRQFNISDFAGLSQIAAGAIPLDLPKSVQKYRRSSVVTSRLNKVKEIQDRVNKAVKDYEAAPAEDAAEANYLIKDIEENLFNIEDDMLRINVSILMEKFRKMSLQLKDEMRYLNASRGGERKRELLESLQNWMDEDHFDDLDDDEPRSESPLPDAEMVTGYLTHVEQNMKKIAGLEAKIKQLKSHGDDTAYLERQRNNLQRQVKQDVLDSEFRRRHSKDHDKKQEFTYLKNAANEIYDLLNRTRMEGMAESHQFEENLQKILRQMEERDRDIEYLEKRVNQQKKLVKQWYNDYEKLQNDHILTKDEVLIERKQNKKLQTEIEKLKIKPVESDKKKKPTGGKTEQKEKLPKEVEQHISTMKQKLEVISWTLKEKEQQVEELQRHVHQLKNALRKNSSVHYPTEALYKPVEREPSKSSNGKRESSTPSCNQLKMVEVGVGNRVVPPPTPSTASGREEVEILRARVAGLEKEKLILEERAKKEQENADTRKPHVETTHQGTQTDASQPKRDVTPPVIMTSQGVQTHSVPTLQYKTPKERRNLYQVAHRMSQQFGPQWIESATMLSHLEEDDIHELEQGVACQQDYIRMFSGSPPEHDDDVDDVAEKRKINELNEAREDLVSCRVTTSIRQLAGEMLGGKDPQVLEQNNLASINTMHTEMENMLKSVTGFVSKAQAVIGCQTGMMNEANEVIKKNLPSNIQNKLEKSRAKGGISSQTSLSCSEHSQEWRDMSLTEQIRCKLKLVEDSMKTNIHEVMNVYINEVAKQHAEYSDIHTSVQDDSRIDVKKVVSDPESAMRNIQNKVESSVRYMARVTRAERGMTRQLPRHASTTVQAQEMGEGANLADQHVGRQAGTWTALGRRPTKIFHSHTAPEEPQQPLSLFGHAATAAYKKTQQGIKTKPSTVETGGRTGRPRDFQLARIRRAKLKPELRGLGMVVKNSAVHRDLPQGGAHPTTGFSRISPVVTGTMPVTQSYQEQRPRRIGESRVEELTLSDLQQQLVQKPLQSKRTGTIERFRSTPTPHPYEPVGPTMVISHVTKQVNPLTGNTLVARDVKLPKIF